MALLSPNYNCMKHENFDLLLGGRVQACITSEHCFHIEFLEAYNKHKRMSKDHHTLGFLNQTTHIDQLSVRQHSERALTKWAVAFMGRTEPFVKTSRVKLVLACLTSKPGQ